MKNPLSLNFTLTPPQKEACFTKANEILYGGAAGGGKVVANYANILTPFGWKLGKDLKVGTLINNPDGTVQRIIAITEEMTLERWRVHFSDQTYTDVAKGHLWLAWRGRKGRKINNVRLFGEQSAEVVETQEILSWIEKGYNPQIPVCQPQPFNRTTKEVDRLDPYTLGVLLGDGHMESATITCHENDKQHYLEYLGRDQVSYNSYKSIRFIGEKRKYIIKKLTLYKLNKALSHTKFIPEVYKFSSIETRLALIQGMMDTDGWSAPDKNACYYDTTSKQLADDAAFILRSLGAVVTITKGQGAYKNKEGVKIICKDVYHLYIKHRQPDSLFRMKRKQFGSFGAGLVQKSITRIEIGETVTGRCITVSHPNGLYVTDDFAVTHNSFLARAAAIYYSFNIPYLQTYFFRRFMDDIKKNHMEGPKGFRALLDPFVKEKMVQIVEDEIRFLETGAKIFLCFCNDPRDVYKYQSYEFHFLLIEEAGQFSEEELRFLRTRSRMVGVKTPQHFKNMFPRILYTANPGGQGHLVLKRMFIEGKAPNRVYQTPDDDGGMARIYIPAKIHDNPFLLKDDPGYIARLKGMGSPQMVEAFLNGNWNSVVGAFFPEFSPTTHVLKPFPIPAHWVKWMGYDSGFADPFSIGWYTKAANDMIAQNKDGQPVPIPAGSIIRYKEWYGANEAGKGLHLTVQEIINGIKERETQEEYNQITVRAASKDLFKRQGGFPLAKLFADSGLYLTMADDDRISGWNMVRDLMRGKNGTPELYVFSNCDRFVEIIPTCQTDLRKPEDMAQFNDHIAEELRYAIKAHIQQQPESGGKLIKPASRVMQELTLDELYSLESKYANQRRRRHGFNSLA